MLNHDAIIEQQLLDQSLVEGIEYDTLYADDEEYDDDAGDRFQWFSDDFYVESYDAYEEETRLTGTKIA